MPETPPLPLLEGDWDVDSDHPDGVLFSSPIAPPTAERLRRWAERRP